MVEKITHNNKLLSIIISHKFQEKGIHFFTSDEFAQQVAYMRHDAGKVIQPHLHKHMKREVVDTQEVLVIKRGKIRVDFYDDNKNYLESRILEAGDVILLVQGAHGFEVLEELEMVEVKQGPYVGTDDKVRFTPAPRETLRIPK